MVLQKIFVDGNWREGEYDGTFQAVNPTTKQKISGDFPVTTWPEMNRVLNAAEDASVAMRDISGNQIADFLDDYVVRINARHDELVAMAQQETALGDTEGGRLHTIEFNGMTGQLSQAAAAARDGSWRDARITTANNIRSGYGMIGPVAVFGPNNFPFRFNSVAGGDFAAAVVAGNPIIAKANTSHPGTTKMFMEEAVQSARDTGMPRGFLQLVYRTSHEDGAKLVTDPRLGATGYTGSRKSGLALKAAADAVGNPIYLELSSVNPGYILPGALEERLDDIAGDFTTSALMGAGQFCTNPGVTVVYGPLAQTFIDNVAARFDAATPGTLLSEGVYTGLKRDIATLIGHGAEVVTGNVEGKGVGFNYANTVLRVDGKKFLDNPAGLQTEAFGNSSLFVVAENQRQAAQIANTFEGNLTGWVYRHTGDKDDSAYAAIAPTLRHRVGRLLNDKMPTGVLVVDGMNHGGPFPSTGHPGYTAVGMPGSVPRFAQLQSYDNVRPGDLPDWLQDRAPNDTIYRRVDGKVVQGNGA